MNPCRKMPPHSGGGSGVGWSLTTNPERPVTPAADPIACVIRTHTDQFDPALDRMTVAFAPAEYGVGTAFRSGRRVTIAIREWVRVAGTSPPQVGGWRVVLRRAAGLVDVPAAAARVRAWRAAGGRAAAEPTVELLVGPDGTVSPVAWGSSGSPLAACELLTVPDFRRQAIPGFAQPQVGSALLPRTGPQLLAGRAADWANLHVAVVGAGRLGGLAVECLAAQGVRRFTVIDADRLEDGNFDGLAVIGRAATGTPKAVALARSLTRLIPDATAVAVPHRFPDAGTVSAVATADLVVSAPDDDRTRLRAGGLAYTLALQPHLDLAAGTDQATGRAGADVRLLLPGRGCLLCLGGVADPLGRPPTSGTAPRVINGMAAHLGGQLLLDWFARPWFARSCWVRVRTGRDGGVSVTRQDAARPQTDCPWCSRKSEQKSPPTPGWFREGQTPLRRV